MKEELYKKLLELINSGQNFLNDQLPDVAQQLITYSRIESIAWIISMFTLAIVFIKLIRFFHKSEGLKFETIIFSVLLLMSLILMMTFSVDLIQSYATPKAYLIKSLQGCCR